jgi:hypothetical protein
MNDNLKGNFDYTERVLDRTEYCDLSDDYTLPDYMPAIGRVISCSATVAPPSLYIGGGSVELAGGAKYFLHYESAEDASLWCAELPSEYDHLVPAERLQNVPFDPAAIGGLVTATAENVSARITGPRRLTVRSKIRLGMGISSPAKFETAFQGDVSRPDAIRYLEGSSPYGISSCGISAPVVCRAKIPASELGVADSGNCRIISSRGKVMVTRLEAMQNALDCRGEINATLLFVANDESERPRRITRRIPFSAEIPLNTVAQSATLLGARAYGVCPSFIASADDDGVSLEATLLLCGEASFLKSFDYIRDVYSCAAECELSGKEFEVRVPVACFNGNATVSAQAKCTSLGLDGGVKLIDCRGEVLPGVEWDIRDNGKLAVNGKMKLFLIADDGAELVPAEFESDFRYIADLPEASSLGAPKINIIADIFDAKCRLDGETVYTDCELCVSILAEDEKKIRTISSVNLIPAKEKDRSPARIIVCYPEKDATLWAVAKRYRADAAAIADKNSLELTAPDSPDSLSKARFLII